MENNEKYIIEHLKEHRESVDMDELWAGVSPHIPKEKRRNRIGFWIFGGVIFCLIATSILFINKVDDFVNGHAENTQIQSSNKLVNAKPSDKNSLIQNYKEDTKDSKVDEIDISLKSAVSISSDIIPSKQIERKNDHEKDFFSQGTQAIDKIPQDLVNMSFSKKLNDNLKEEKDIHKSKAKIELFPIGVANLEGKNKDRVLVRNMNLLPINVKKLSFGEITNYDKLQVTKIINPSIGLKVKRLGVYLLGGGSIVNRSLRTKTIELQGERDRRNSTVDVLGAWQVEGGIGLRITSKIKILAGLNYTQIHEKASFESEYLVDFEIETNSLILRQDGTIEDENGVNTAQGIRHIKETRYNRLRMLSIPVRISYKLLNFDNLSIEMGAMASYSISQSYIGYTSLSGSADSYNLTLDEDNKFRTNGAVSYGLNIAGSTHLSNLLDLTFSIGYQKTKNINNGIYLIDQQYNSLSLTGGMYRRF